MFKGNDTYAVVRRSHLTTRLMLLSGYTTRHEDVLFLKLPGVNDMYAAVRRSHLTT